MLYNSQSSESVRSSSHVQMEQPFAFFSPRSQRDWRQLRFLSPEFVPPSVFLFRTLRPFPSVCGLECRATGKEKVAECRMCAHVKLCERGRTESERAQLLLVRDFWSPSPLPLVERDCQGTVSNGSEKRRGGDTSRRLMLGAMHHSCNTSGRAKALSQETGKSSAEPCVCVYFVWERVLLNCERNYFRPCWKKTAHVVYWLLGAS